MGNVVVYCFDEDSFGLWFRFPGQCDVFYPLKDREMIEIYDEPNYLEEQVLQITEDRKKGRLTESFLEDWINLDEIVGDLCRANVNNPEDREKVNLHCLTLLQQVKKDIDEMMKDKRYTKWE